MPSKFQLTLNGEVINFSVTKRPNQKRIIVKPNYDGYQVSAPKGTAIKTIKQMIISHQTNILKIPHRLDFNTTLKGPKTIRLFGTSYPVLYAKTKGGVSFDNQTIMVRSQALNEENIKRLLKAFLKEKLLLAVEELHQKTQKQFPDFPLKTVTFDARYVHSKFGSCYPKRKYIRFNLALVHYPIHFLRFIYFHEITHLKHPDHSKAFYQTFSIFEPNHIPMKKALQTYHEQYMRDMKNHI